MLPGSAGLPEQCQAAHERAAKVHDELDTSLSPQAKAAAERYVAKPGPGASLEKAWGDYAAAALLGGDAPVAAWAGLKAAEIEWNGETVSNAGVYLHHLGKAQEALQLLNCAYEMGYRSPYLLEALAVLHQTQGNNARARQAIQAAMQMAPDDPVIEIETSFINNGQPPRPQPPERDPDGLDEAIREIEEHGQRAVNLIKIQADELEGSLPDSNAHQYYRIAADYVNNLIGICRTQARAARTADSTLRQGMINGALGTCVSGYAQISDTLLSFPDSTETNGSPLLFWADVLRIDSHTLSSEQEGGWPEAIRWSMHGLGPALSQPAETEYRRAKDAAYREYNERDRACRDNPCKIREQARFCGIWKQLYERWEDASRQRHNAAARGFDRIATRTVMQAENEWLQVRDYAVRQLKKMRFQKMPGFDMEQMTLQGINMAIRPVYERHVNRSENIHSGTVVYLRERAQWFESERSSMERVLAGEAEAMQRTCGPAMRALLELLIQEEWQAYLDYLRDRLARDIDLKTETSEFPCEGSVGPVSLMIDFEKGKIEGKWTAKEWGPFKGSRGEIKGGVSVSGSYTRGKGFSSGGGVGFSGKTTAGDRAGTSGTYDSSGGGVGAGGGIGPFAGKGKVSLTTKVNPYNNREYTGIKVKGSAGLGLGGKLRGKSAGVACYPSSGSVTFYPRAILEDAYRYMTAPSSPPPRGGGR